MKKIAPLYQFELSLENHSEGNGWRRIKEKSYEGKPGDFFPPVSSTQTPKVYLIFNREELIYVGYSGQGMAARLGYSLKPKHQKNYQGYAWRKADQLTLWVYCFKPFHGSVKDSDAQKKFAEAVEAELVFLWKERTGVWPAGQTEIHFNNWEAEQVKKLANRILDQVK